MNLTLPAAVEEYIDERVRSGKYRNAEDVITAALGQLQQHEDVVNLPPEELEAIYPGAREKIKQGLEAAKAGRLIDGEEFFAELEKELDLGEV
jgi:putative addiction module CopG family antidote